MCVPPNSPIPKTSREDFNIKSKLNNFMTMYQEIHCQYVRKLIKERVNEL